MRNSIPFISLVSYLYRAITAGPQIITKYTQNGRLKAETSSLHVWTSIFMGFEQISVQDPSGPHNKKKILRRKKKTLFEISSGNIPMKRGSIFLNSCSVHVRLHWATAHLSSLL